MVFSWTENSFPGRCVQAPKPGKNSHSFDRVEVLNEIIDGRTIMRGALDGTMKFNQLIPLWPMQLPLQNFGNPCLQQPAGLEEQPRGFMVLLSRRGWKIICCQ
jgi:hypothetical protein